MEKHSLLDHVIAPLTWLERARGWQRLGLLLLYVMVLLVGGVVGYRALVLWGLPDIGDPFDLERFGTVTVADADDAMILYHQAMAKRVIPDHGTQQTAATLQKWSVEDWAMAAPEVRRWVDDNRPALAVWLEATGRPDSLLAQPRDQGSSTPLMIVDWLGSIASLANLEASRLEEQGDLAGAWRLHRGVLRSSRHVGMHGGAMQRNVGLHILNRAIPGIENWAEDPRVTPGLLKAAIADVETCRDMSAPAAEMIRANYFLVRSVLDQPDGFNRFDPRRPDPNDPWFQRLTIVSDLRAFLGREPERSRRILNLIVAGQLARQDSPPASRPPFASGRYPIYEVDSGTPAPVAAIAPQDLEAWADRSWFGPIWQGLLGWSARLAVEPGIFDRLLLRMAERAYQVEHGRPAKTYGELLGPYLRALPEGLAEGDAVFAESGAN